MNALTTEEIIADLRQFAILCSRNLAVPMDAILTYVAEFGGVEQYANPDDYVGQIEFREKVRGFCTRYVVDHLPPEQRDAVGSIAANRQRANGAFSVRDFWKLAEPELKACNVLRSDWNVMVCRALGLSAIMCLYKHPGDEAHAVAQLVAHLDKQKQRVPEGGRLTMTKAEDAKRKQVLDHTRATFEKLGITSPAAQGIHVKRIFNDKTLPDVIFGLQTAEEIIAQFDEGMKDVKKKEVPPVDNLFKAGNGPTTGNGGTVSDATDRVTNTVNDTKSEEKAGDAIPFDETPPVQAELPDASKSNQEGQGGVEVQSKPIEPEAKNEVALPTDASQNKPPEPPQGVLTGEFSAAVGDVVFTCLLTDVSDGTYGLVITVDDLESIGKMKDAILEKIKLMRGLLPDHVLIIDWIETNPSLDRINNLRQRAGNLAKATYPNLTADQQAAKIVEAWDGKSAKDAICAWGDDGALEKVRLAFEKVEPEQREDLVAKATMTVVDMPSEVAAREPSNIVSFPGAFGFRLPTPADWQFMLNMSKFVVASGFYPAIKTPEAAMMIMIKGFTLGADPIASLDGIDPIQSSRGITMFFRGKFAKALVERTGQCEKFIVTGDDKKAQAVVKRKGRDENIYTFTMEDAKQADLAKKNIWQSHPGKMLKWRVISQAVSIEFPEVYFAFSAAGPEDEEEAA